MSVLGPLILLMGLVIADRSGLVAVPSMVLSGAGVLLVLFPLFSRRATRVRSRQGDTPLPLPPWKQMLAAYGAVLLLFVVLLIATA